MNCNCHVGWVKGFILPGLAVKKVVWDDDLPLA
jgi:hypothetical protein